jgi:hypothetical protein
MRRRFHSGLLLLCLLVATPAFAQTDPDKLWIEVNIGAAIARDAGYTAAVSFPLRNETAQSSVAYDRPTGGLFDVGVGYMLHRRIGVGISIVGTGHVAPATLTSRIPHPVLPNQPATDVATTDRDLAWSEGTVNLQALIRLTPVESRVFVRAFGGPTRFIVSQQAVSNISYAESLNTTTGAYTIAVDGVTYQDAEAEGWGFHLGADAGYFFNNHVGVGAVVKFNTATITFDDPVLATASPTVDLKAGGVQVGGGLRLKF